MEDAISTSCFPTRPRAIIVCFIGFGRISMRYGCGLSVEKDEWEIWNRIETGLYKLHLQGLYGWTDEDVLLTVA